MGDRNDYLSNTGDEFGGLGYYGATYEDARDAELATPNLTGYSINDFKSDEISDLMSYMTPQELIEFDALLRNSPPRALMPHQLVPHEEDWWEVYLLLGGRGVGKTVAGASEVRAHLRKYGKAARIGIGAPTVADVRDICMEGETGLITMFPNEFTSYKRSLGEAHHIDGGFVKAMGTEKPKRWNGPQWSMIWFDELSLCNQDAWNDANLGLRLGEKPYALATCTPKNRKWVKALAQDKTTYVPQYYDEKTGRLRLPTTFDNLFLPKRRVQWLKNKFGGTRLGRQELEGAFLDDVEGSMWKRDNILHETDPKNWPRMVRIVVAIDPAGSASRKVADKNAQTEEQRNNLRKNADTGIAVVGLGVDNKFYVMEVKSGQWTPEQWAVEAIKLYIIHRADEIIAEKNFGGDMVESNIRTIDQWNEIKTPDGFKRKVHLQGRHLPIKLVTASRGKDVRAQPVASLYEQHKVFHCEYFGAAEDQMCAFVDADDNDGADMVDSLVWAFTKLAGLDMTGNSYLVLPGDKKWRSFVVR